MSAPRPRRKGIHISFFIVLAMLIYAIIMLLNQSSVIKDQKEREADLLRRQEALEMQIHSLENELEYIGSDEYIEKIARERLGWIKDDEIKFVDSDEAD